MYVWSFSSHLRIFHAFGDVTTTVNGYKFWPMLGTHDHWAVRVLKCTTPTVTRANFYNDHLDLRTPDTHTCFRALGRGAVVTCFHALHLSWPGIEPQSPSYEANTLYTFYFKMKWIVGWLIDWLDTVLRRISNLKWKLFR